MLWLQTPWVVQLLWQQLSCVLLGEWHSRAVAVLAGAGFLPGDDLLQRNQCFSGYSASPCPQSPLPVQAETGTRGFGPNSALNALSHVRAVNVDNSTVSFGCPLLGGCSCTSNSLAAVVRLFLTCFSIPRRLCDAEELTHKVFFLAVMCWSRVRNS